eukprot:2278401-Rhodomonas_salina.2
MPCVVLGPSILSARALALRCAKLIPHATWLSNFRFWHSVFRKRTLPGYAMRGSDMALAASGSGGAKQL